MQARSFWKSGVLEEALLRWDRFLSIILSFALNPYTVRRSYAVYNVGDLTLNLFVDLL